MILHLRVIKGYPMVEGSVDGQAGLFMLDTGTPFRVLLNRHYVTLPKGVAVGKGGVSSGQPLAFQAHPGAHVMRIGGYSFGAGVGGGAGARLAPGETSVSADFDFIEQGLAPSFLGFVGWGLFKDYVFVLDYGADTAELYPRSAGGRSVGPKVNADAIDAVVRYTPAGAPFELDINGVKAPAVFDSGGGQGGMVAPAEIWARLSATLKPLPRQDDTECVALIGARYDGHELAPAALDKAVGNDTHVTLASGFLRNYRSIWNPLEGTVTLERIAVAPKAPEGCQ